jgi:hypothetical protein
VIHCRREHLSCSNNTSSVEYEADLAEIREWVDAHPEVEDETAIHHLEFIVRTIGEHLTGIRCAHEGAGNFCPTCGARG